MSVVSEKGEFYLEMSSLVPPRTQPAVTLLEPVPPSDYVTVSLELDLQAMTAHLLIEDVPIGSSELPFSQEKDLWLGIFVRYAHLY